MADLFGTYSKRIEVTIDHTKIPSDLTWFPVTVFLTSSQGEEVFTEFDADEDFDRIAFTSSDGETQLYADCELFDVSENKAIYHVSKTGWTVSSSTDTDIYLYYDNTADHNTTYISKSGDTAAQSVWDSNFKAVYHMNDTAEPTYDTEYDGSVEPDSDGWSLGGTDYASSDGDILTINTSASDSYTCYYYKTPDVDFDAGFYLKTRVKIRETYTQILISIRDGTQDEIVYFTIKYDSISYWDGSNHTIANVDADSDYFVYEIYIKDTTAYFYVDGTYKGSCTVWSNTGSDSVLFGDEVGSWDTYADIDYLNYALDIGYNPAGGIVDATSNHNDGNKKADGEPTEATGKVGQGQDFDGINDYIDIGTLGNFGSEMDTNKPTFEAIVKTSNTTDIMSLYGTFNDGYITGIQENFNNDTNGVANGYILLYLRDEDDHEFKTDSDASTNINNNSYHHFATTIDGGSNTVTPYIDSSSVAVTNIDAATPDNFVNFQYGMAIGARNVRGTMGQSFEGIIDEFRISNTNRSAAWIGATYSTLFDTLLTYGSEETSGTTHSVSGSSDSVLSTSSSINITWDLSGSTDSVLSTSANLNVIFDIAGSSDSVLTTSSTIDLGVIEKLAGSSNSVLTTTAILKAICGLSGSSDSTLETSAIIGAIRGLSGTSDSILETLATLGLDRIKLSGSSDSVLSTLSTLNTILSLTGSSNNSLTTSATLNLIYSLSGSSNSSIDTSALLNAIFSLSGSSNSVLDTIATELIVAAVQKLTGSADSTISTLADLGIIKSFGGSADAVFDTIATINALHRLLGNAQSSVDTSGNINLTWSLSGASNSIITTLGVLTPGIIEGLSGTVTCVIDTSGVLTRIRVWFPVDDVGGSWTNVDDTDGSWVQVSDTDGNWTQVRRPRW